MAEKTEKPEAEAEEKKPAKKSTLAVRLLADYWDAEGNRHKASYVDANGEARESGAIIELPAEEARALVKTHAAERGDDF
jgi:hypothetical protein